MSKVLSHEGDFIVTDSTLINLFVAAFFYVMAFTAIFYNSGSIFLNIVLLLGFIPGIVFTIKAFKKRAAITINKNGIYFFNSLVTDWQHFKSANAKQMPLGLGQIADNVVLTIEYNRDSVTTGFYKKSIPLSSTQNKSEEEIIGAIEFFYEASREKITLRNFRLS